MVNDKDKYVEKRRILLQSLADIAKQRNITHDAIAERTGFIRNNVSRMFAGKYPPSLDNFLMLCDAAGVSIKLDLKQICDHDFKPIEGDEQFKECRYCKEPYE